MLNEERVKHMVKLALYETKNGDEEFKISSYYKKDYINFNMCRSIVWMTVAYIILLVLLGMTFMSKLLADFSIAKIVLVVIAVVGIYVALLITYIVASRKFYKRKHARAYHHVKRFTEDLAELESMYEKEDNNGKII